MFNLMSFNTAAPLSQGGKGGGRVDMIENGAQGIDRMTFDPHLLRPYRTRLRRHVGGDRYAEYGNEVVCVNVSQGMQPVVDSYNQPVKNEQGLLQYREHFEVQPVQHRRAHDLPVIHGYVTNANTLRKDQWVQLDQKLLEVRRRRLKLWALMRSKNTMSIDGMSTPILEHERLVDAGEAVVSMSPKTRGNNFNPHFELDALPLPITHCDFDIDARFLAVSRARGGTSAELTRGQFAARRVAEMVEQTAIGSVNGVQFGDASDYLSAAVKVVGLTNHADRITKTDLVAATGISGANWYANVTAMLVLAEAQNVFGPYTLFVSSSYDQTARDDYSAQYAKSIRQRTLELDTLQDIVRLDYLTGDVMILVEWGEEVEAVNGMEFTTVQRATTDWEELSFKHMGIQVPRIRSKNVNTGTTGPATSATAIAPIVHGTTA